MSFINNVSELVEKVKASVKKEEYDYFEFFVDMVRCAGRAAQLLEDFLLSFDRNKLEEGVKIIHEVEHSADVIKHTMLERLLKEFLPPVDREDIIKLAHALDNVVDNIEDIIRHMYMFDVCVCRGEAVQFAGVIRRSCEALEELLVSFSDYKKATGMQARIIEINSLEEEGDAIYTGAVHTLFTDGTLGKELVAWKDIFDCFENCCDDCEHVADVVEEVLMKNT